MKTLRNAAKILSVALIFTLVFALCSCDLFGGSLKLESFTVDRSTIKTVYNVGEAVDFSGIKAVVKYSDESLNTEYTAADLTVSYDEDITATAGTKTVTVSFEDPHLEVTQTTTFRIAVRDPNASDSEGKKVAQFEQSGELNSFASDNKTDGKLSYGDTGFSGQFLKGGKLYVIGDDNAFKMVPAFAVENEDGTEDFLTAFYSDVDVYLYVENEYVLLEKTAGEQNEYSYTYNGEVIVKVDTYHGEYKFEKPLEQVKISVLPSAERYEGTEELNPVVLEARVIDAYNVHEAWELAVLDNDPSREDWNAFKTEKGLLGVDPAGIVLHADLHVSENDVPQSFFKTSTADVVYTNSVSGETKTIPAGTKYLIDETVVYSRQGAAEFVIEGNFFTVDTKSFPLVASPAVFNDEGYGSDFSNAVFIAFEAFDDNFQSKPADVPEIVFNNVALIGNAARDNWVDANDKLVTAGGLIMIRSSRYAHTTLNNVINNSFFISYFTDYEGTMIVNDSKCYDSYQNGAFVWADSVLEVNDSFINGSGGPVIISQSVMKNGQVNEDGEQVNGTGNYYNPKTVLTNTVVETHLSGEEVWFSSIDGIAPLVAQIKALGAGMHGKGLGNFVDADGKMNIKAILMRDGSSASAMTDIYIQGTVSHEGSGIDRWMTSELWGGVMQAFAQNPALAAAPILTVYQPVMGGDNNDEILGYQPYTVYFDGTTFRDLQNRVLGTDASHAALVAAFASATQISLSQGGLSVLLDFYHY